MATIMPTHVARKIAADAPQLCPGIRIHIIDIVHPPGIRIPRDIEAQK